MSPEKEVPSTPATTTFTVIASVEPSNNPENGDDDGLVSIGVAPLGFLGQCYESNIRSDLPAPLHERDIVFVLTPTENEARNAN